jgi:hypothetical protein
MARVSIHIPHLDAAENAFIERKLEYVKSKVYEQPYPDLLGRQMVPVSHEVPAGAETIKYDIFDKVGLAQRIRSYSDNLPRANVKVREERSPVHGYGIAYGYSNRELRASILANVNLDAREASAARFGFELAVDVVAALGNSEGLLGLLTLPNANIYTVPADGTGTSPLLLTKTPDQIIRDLNGVSNKSVGLTNGIEMPDTLALPIDQYNYIASTPRSANSDTTILKFFLGANPFVKTVIPWYRCKGAGSGGTDRMIAYKRSPEKMTLEIPMEFTQQPPQLRNLAVDVPCEGEVGGVICPYPMSVTYGDGI